MNEINDSFKEINRKMCRIAGRFINTEAFQADATLSTWPLVDTSANRGVTWAVNTTPSDWLGQFYRLEPRHTQTGNIFVVLLWPGE